MQHGTRRGRGLGAGLLAAAATLVAFSGTPASAGVPALSGDLKSRAMAGLEVARGEVITLSLPEGVGQPIVTPVQLGGEQASLVLEPYSTRASDFKVLVDKGDGRLHEVPAPAIVTMRGRVDGVPGSLVVASLHDQQLRATVYLDGVAEWHIQPLSDGDAQAARDLHAVYRFADVVPIADSACGHDLAEGGRHRLAHAGYGQNPPPPQTVIDPAPASACANVCEIGIDADYEYFVANGSSVNNVVADIETVMNEVEAVYARDAQIGFQTTTIIVRQTSNDPYSSTDPSTALSEFGNEWYSFQSGVRRDVAHLFVGRDIAGSIVGAAYTSSVCNVGAAYSYSQSRFSTNLARRTIVTAHELGHNFGASHCSSSGCGIMCSSVGACGGDQVFFGSGSIGQIQTYRDRITCLSAASGTPLPPVAQGDSVTTQAGSPASVAVLANDSDPNCGDSISISAYQSTSVRGGTVSMATGAAAPALMYTPKAGFSGSDSFTYTIRDTTGRTSSATVSAVVEPGPGPVVPEGLEARYYSIGSISLLPNFSTMTPYSTGRVDQVSFAPTSGNFAGSNRSYNVAAVFEGWLTVPRNDTYTFYTESNDGSKLYVNNALVVNNDGAHDMLEKSGAITLNAGAHLVRTEFFERTGDAGLYVRISGGGLAKQVVPASMWGRPSSGGGGGSGDGEPTPGCLADANGDTLLDGFDFNAFVDAFNANDLARADANGDTLLDGFDFNAYADAFNAGCE